MRSKSRRKRRTKDEPPQLLKHKVRRRDGRVDVYAYAVFSGEERRYGRFDDEARRLFAADLAAWEANGGTFPADPAGDDPGAPFTVADLVNAYQSHVDADPQHDAAWQRNNGDRLRGALDVLTELHGDCPASEFGPKRFVAMREHLAALLRDDGRPLYCRSTITERMRIVRAAFEHAVVTERVAPDVVHGLEAAVRRLRTSKAGRPKRKRRPVDRETFDAVKPYMPKPVAAILELMWLTPTRPSELVPLRPCDFDRSRDDVWLVELDRHKTAGSGVERVLKFGPRCIEVLRPFMLRPARRPLFTPAEGLAEHNRQRREARRTPLYPSHERRYAAQRAALPDRVFRDTYDANALRKAVERAVRRCNAERADAGLAPVPMFTPYQVRHAALTRLAAEHGKEGAQAAADHADLRTTEVYCHTARALGIEVARLSS